MKNCLIVDDSAVHPESRAAYPRVHELQGRGGRGRRQGPDGLRSKRCPTSSCSTGTCRPWTATSSSGFLRQTPRRPGAEGSVLHHRERRRCHRTGAACRRRRVHHEAVRPRHRHGQARTGWIRPAGRRRLTRRQGGFQSRPIVAEVFPSSRRSVEFHGRCRLRPRLRSAYRGRREQRRSRAGHDRR